MPCRLRKPKSPSRSLRCHRKSFTVSRGSLSARFQAQFAPFCKLVHQPEPAPRSLQAAASLQARSGSSRLVATSRRARLQSIKTLSTERLTISARCSHLLRLARLQRVRQLLQQRQRTRLPNTEARCRSTKALSRAQAAAAAVRALGRSINRKLRVRLLARPLALQLPKLQQPLQLLRAVNIRVQCHAAQALAQARSRKLRLQARARAQQPAQQAPAQRLAALLLLRGRRL